MPGVNLSEIFEAQVFLSRYGGVPFAESESLTRDQMNLAIEKINDWLRQENDAENKRTEVLAKAMGGVVSGVAHMG